MQRFRSTVVINTLSLILLAPVCVTGQERSHVTSGQVTRAIQELETIAQKKIQEGAVPGIAIAVVFQDGVVYAKGFGVRDVNTKESIDADTVFQLASVSKPIGSTVVAELVGEGKITWDSKLSALDPGFAMFDPWVTREITIRDMYAHRSGLPDHAGDLLEDLLVEGNWVQKFKRDPDAQSPTGGVSSSVNDVAKWVRLQLANGKFDRRQIVDEKALAETHHPHMLTGFNPFTELPTFYGLGWNVGYDQQGRLRLNHSGAFDLGAATYVNLVASKQLGVVVLT